MPTPAAALRVTYLGPQELAAALITVLNRLGLTVSYNPAQTRTGVAARVALDILVSTLGDASATLAVHKAVERFRRQFPAVDIIVVDPAARPRT